MKSINFFITVGLAFFLILTFSVSVTQAQEASNSSTTIEEIQKSLEQRIKKAIQGDLKSDHTSKLRAFVGTVSNISQNSISITTTSITKIATTDPQTNILRNNAQVKFETIRIGDGIIAMGYTTDNQTQTALRLVLYEPKLPKATRSVNLGSLQTLDNKKQTLKLITNQSTQNLSFSDKTKFFNANQQTLKPSQISEHQLALAIISTNQSIKAAFLISLLVLNQASTPPPPTSGPTTTNRCGDGTCQDVVCQGLNCPQPETPETCPTDCTQ